MSYPSDWSIVWAIVLSSNLASRMAFFSFFMRQQGKSFTLRILGLDCQTAYTAEIVTGGPCIINSNAGHAGHAVSWMLLWFYQFLVRYVKRGLNTEHAPGTRRLVMINSCPHASLLPMVRYLR
jgi:hypothetical protein